jgi:hypothetical protein
MGLVVTIGQLTARPALSQGISKPPFDDTGSDRQNLELGRLLIDLKDRVDEVEKIRAAAFDAARKLVEEAEVGSLEIGQAAMLMVEIDPAAAAPVLVQHGHRLRNAAATADLSNVEAMFPLLPAFRKTGLDGLAAILAVLRDPEQEFSLEQTKVLACAASHIVTQEELGGRGLSLEILFGATLQDSGYRGQSDIVRERIVIFFKFSESLLSKVPFSRRKDVMPQSAGQIRLRL